MTQNIPVLSSSMFSAGWGGRSRVSSVHGNTRFTNKHSRMVNLTFLVFLIYRFPGFWIPGIGLKSLHEFGLNGTQKYKLPLKTAITEPNIKCLFTANLFLLFCTEFWTSFLSLDTASVWSSNYMFSNPKLGFLVCVLAFLKLKRSRRVNIFHFRSGSLCWNLTRS